MLIMKKRYKALEGQWLTAGWMRQQKIGLCISCADTPANGRGGISAWVVELSAANGESLISPSLK